MGSCALNIFGYLFFVSVPLVLIIAICCCCCCCACCRGCRTRAERAVGIKSTVNVVLEQQLMNINNTTVNSVAAQPPPPQPTGFYSAPQNYNPAYPPPSYPPPSYPPQQSAPYHPPQASDPTASSPSPVDEIAKLRAQLAEAELRAAANSKA